MVPCRYMQSAYRRPLIVAELLGYNADVVCLQEVDERAFDRYFAAQMRNAGGPAGLSYQFLPNIVGYL